jgi:demethylmenaquinone methyltransferase/2-methoxy-6-polyprenyl-1,4-benzoquinol methylase
MKSKQYPSVTQATTAEHIGMVKEIFGTITERYDFLNHFLSLGLDFFWRRFAVRHMRFFQTQRLLDVACGTGDLAMDAASRYPLIKAVGLDFVKEMMDKAQPKLAKAGLAGRIRLVLGDATCLPFADDSFDVVSIGFGIRNIPDRLRALQEMTRVTAPGGRVLVLEFTVPSNRILRVLHIFYLEQILPRLAKSFTANAHAYIYLADSIKNFPPPDQFAALMAEAGLIEVQKYPLTLGITYLFSGTKPSI